MRIYIDTDVLIDFFAQREPYVADVKKLLVMQAFGDAELWTSAQAYLNVYFIAKSKMDVEPIQAAMRESLDRINVSPITHMDILDATSMGWDDVEDALIAECCEKAGADYLVTRDKSRFGAMSTPVVTPDELFDALQNEHGVTYLKGIA